MRVFLVRVWKPPHRQVGGTLDDPQIEKQTDSIVYTIRSSDTATFLPWAEGTEGAKAYFPGCLRTAGHFGSKVQRAKGSLAGGVKNQSYAEIRCFV
jgi:hypothetical protein